MSNVIYRSVYAVKMLFLLVCLVVKVLLSSLRTGWQLRNIHIVHGNGFFPCHLSLSPSRLYLSWIWALWWVPYMKQELSIQTGSHQCFFLFVWSMLLIFVLFCVVVFCFCFLLFIFLWFFSSFCVLCPNVAYVSWLSIPECPFGFSFGICQNIYSSHCNVSIFSKACEPHGWCND